MLRLIRIFSSPGTICLKSPQPLTNFLARFGTFSPREFQYETSDGESGTLMHRFSRHVSLTKRDFTDKTKYGFKVSNFYPLPDVDSYGQQIRDLETVDLAKLITFTTDFRSKTDFRSYTEIVNALDEECVRRVPKATMYELLEMLHCFMYLLPNKIAQLKSYQTAMPKLIQLFDGGSENEPNFMSIVFFLGLWKRNKTGTILMKEFLQQHLDRYLTPELTQMDFVILANATYKTSLRMADESEAFKSRLMQEIVQFKNEDDSALLVTLIKCARMNRLSSDEIMQKVHSFIEANMARKELDFRGLTHLFAYIADNRIKNDTLTELFVEGCWARFDTEVRTNGFETQTQSCRPKDIGTFLWSCATLGVPMEAYSGVNLNMLEKAIRLKVDAGEYRYIPDVLVDTILSLWICDRKSIGLFRLLFKDRTLLQNLRKERAKLESRKDLLLSCAEIDLPEASDMMKSVRKPTGDAFLLNRSAPQFLLRPGLKKVAECLERLKESKQLPISAISFNLPVKHLNIAGILVKMATGGEKNLDVLDEKHTLSDGESPVGLMKLKTRILKDKAVDQGLVNLCRFDTPDLLEEEIRRILAETKQ
uniref:FAST kinase leucine-rich domain-containing protein n=1 Tax=Anopheles funestus TaxID=62324 RepID=A0A182RRJ7_ANOFN